jgi:cell division protein FtsA
MLFNRSLEQTSPGAGLGLARRPQSSSASRLFGRAPLRKQKSRLIAGLDIGTTKVCAIIAEIDENGGVHVLGLGSAPSRGMRRGVVTNINNTVESLVKAHSQAIELARVRPREIHVGIAGDHISGINLEGMIEVANPEVGIDQRDLNRVQKKALKLVLPHDVAILHSFTKEYVVNGQGGITDPIGLFGNRLQVRMHVVTGSSAAGNNIFRCIRKARLRTTSVVLQSLASSLSVLTPRERELGVVLVDIGGGTSDLAIFHGQTLQHTSEISMGGDIITQDIAKILQTAPHDAENLKKRFGQAVPTDVDADERIELRGPAAGRKRMTHSRRELAEIIEARVEEIFLKIQKHIQLSGCSDKIFAGVVLTGGTALLEGIDTVAHRILGYPCRIGRPQGLLGMGSAVTSPIYATGVGLIRWAIEEGPGYQRDSWLVRRVKQILDVYG